MLIVIGAGIIIFEATRRLVDPPDEIDVIAVGMAVAALSTLANVAVSTFLFRRARELRSPALEGDAAHLQTDAMTSAGLLVGLGFVEVTGVVAFDSITALLIAVAIVVAGIRILSRSSRVLVDEAPPPEELDLIESAIEAAQQPEVVGYHKLRARRSGAHRHIDMHVQFRSGTTLERAHELAHALREAIEEAIPYADVLIHVEPEGSVTPEEEDQPLRHGRLKP
jgi:cation diffusion facilitator family transporter